MQFATPVQPPPKVLFVVHAWGGGTIRLACELADLISDKADVVWVWGIDDKTLHISSRKPYEPDITYDLDAGLRAPLRQLRSYGFRRVNVLHTIGLKRHIATLMTRLRVPYDITFTDYHHFSERPHFEDEEGYFVGDEAVRTKQDAMQSEISPLLAGADRLIAISGDLTRRVQGFVPSKPVIAARVHEADAPTSRSMKGPVLRQNEVMRILNLGRPHPAKGLNLIVDVAERIDRAGLPIEIYCLGETNPVLDVRLRPFKCVKILGAYDQADLPSIVKDIDPHFAWFPFTQPETHSYALSDVMKIGLPVLATAIGAIPERLAERPSTWLVPYDRSMAVTHFEWIEKLYRTRMACEPAWQDICHLPIVDEDFFPKAYLAPLLEAHASSQSRLWDLARLFGRRTV